MYLEHYNLSAKPFQISTDPRFLYMGGDHKEALANLKYGLEADNGYVVLTGAVGTGKTTLINALVATLDESVCLAVVNHPKMEPLEFLSFVARSFDPKARINTKADGLHFLRQFVQQAYEERKNVLLIIDEAHRLSDDLLEEIRLISNMEQSGTKLIQIFFVGQTELKRRLLSTACEALRQRITLYFHLQPLSEEETGRYISHRLSVAGSNTAPFTDGAVRTIYRYSGGYPRRINRLCDRALLTGYVQAMRTINASTVHECAREIDLIDPLRPGIYRLFRLRHKFWRWWDSPGMRDSRTKMVQTLSNGLNQIPSFAISLRRHISGTAAKWGHIAKTALRQTRYKRAAQLTAGVVILLILTGFTANILRTGPGIKTIKPQPPGRIEVPPHITSSIAILPQSKPAQTQANLHEIAKPVPSKEPSQPTLADRAASLVAESNYQQAIALLETDTANALANDEMRDLYLSALLGRAAQLKAQFPERAELLLSKAVAAVPTNVDALVQLGNLYTHNGNYAGATKAYTQALQLDGKLTNVLYNLGFIYANSGEYEKAETALQKVVALKPAYVDKALFNLAVVQEKIGKPEACQASLEAALTIRPGNSKIQAYLMEVKRNQEARP